MIDKNFSKFYEMKNLYNAKKESLAEDEFLRFIVFSDNGGRYYVNKVTFFEHDLNRNCIIFEVKYPKNSWDDGVFDYIPETFNYGLEVTNATRYEKYEVVFQKTSRIKPRKKVRKR